MSADCVRRDEYVIYLGANIREDGAETIARIAVSLDALGGTDHAGVPKGSFGVCVDLYLE